MPSKAKTSRRVVKSKANSKSKQQKEEPVEDVEVEEPQKVTKGKGRKAVSKNTKTTASKSKAKAKVVTKAKSKSKSTKKTQAKKRSKKQSEEESEDEQDEQVEVQSAGAESDAVSDETQEKTKFEQLYDEIAQTKKDIVELQRKEKALLKKLHNTHRSDLKKAGNRKRKPNPKPTGFTVGREIGGKLADWLDVERGTVLTGPELSKAFWAQIRGLNLQSEDDGRIFRTNKEVSKIFGVPKSVNDSNDSDDVNGFNMRTYQTHIKYALKHHNN